MSGRTGCGSDRTVKNSHILNGRNNRILTMAFIRTNVGEVGTLNLAMFFIALAFCPGYARGQIAPETRNFRQILGGISDGQTVQLDPNVTYQWREDVTVSSDDWTLVGQGATVVVQDTPTVRLKGDDWTFGGILFDRTRSDEVSTEVIADGGGWTLQNIGFRGRDTTEGVFFRLGTDEGTTNHLRHIYMPGDVESPSLLNSKRRHQGKIIAEQIWADHAGDNAFYGVGSAKDREAGSFNQGVWVVRDSYFEDNNISCVRVGTEDADSRVENCTFVLTDMENVPGDVKNFRAIWSYYGNVNVKDCFFRCPKNDAMNIYDSNGSTITDLGGNQIKPDYPLEKVPMPAGVPTSAREAAQGP